MSIGYSIKYSLENISVEYNSIDDPDCIAITVWYGENSCSSVRIDRNRIDSFVAIIDEIKGNLETNDCLTRQIGESLK